MEFLVQIVVTECHPTQGIAGGESSLCHTFASQTLIGRERDADAVEQLQEDHVSHVLCEREAPIRRGAGLVSDLSMVVVLDVQLVGFRGESAAINRGSHLRYGSG